MILHFTRFRWWFLVVSIALVGVGIVLSRSREVRLQGIVTDGETPIANATVRLQGTTNYTLTDVQGRFTLLLPDTHTNAHITAWSPGYHIAVGVSHNFSDMQIILRRHPTEDHPEYTFISPVLDSTNPAACSRCHASSTADPLPVDEWLQDAHSMSAINPRFLSLYNGTDLAHRQGSPTVYAYDAALGIDVPQAPSQGQTAVGVGFRLDFPAETGVCATCHAPILALNGKLDERDPNLAQGVAREGITCDFCHKIWDVRLETTGRPSPHLSGVQSLEFLRPAEGEQVFLGPLDDTPGDDIFSPLQRQSQFCAACHTGEFWGVSIYNSFGEWLDSPYNNPVTGKTCQDCHMPPTGTTRFVELPPDVTQYVPPRDPQTIFSHRMPGATDLDLLQNTAELHIETRWQNDQLYVTVHVTNTGAGHHLPTDNPLRNVILLVAAQDGQGQPLSLLEGATIPAWGGIGDPATGHYAGLPGVLFAKVLADYYTDETPAYAYWRQTRLVSDNRIPALEEDVSTYVFQAATSEVTITAQLFLRRAFIELMDLKGWDTPDLLMEQAVVNVTR